MDFRISLKAARVNAGLTQREVAKEMNCSRETILAWESGRTELKASQLQQLSALYKTPIDLIFLPND